jgi:hypothetical protein
MSNVIASTLARMLIMSRSRTRGALVSAMLLSVFLADGCIHHETSTIEVTPDALASTPALRTATNLPDQFTIVTPASTPGDCPSQLRDPGLDATLRLQRSIMRQVPDSTGAGYRALGDYSVEPRGVYGEEVGEGVRVDCARLRAIGVVRL